MTPVFEFPVWQADVLRQVERALENWVPEKSAAGLGDVMRYAVLDGGKRLRPMLVLAASQAVEGHPAAALRAAVAVELVHAYSLVHDDLPCMDNDVLRRGKPTCHVQFGEAQALLAGDAMQALAFEVLTQDEEVPSGLQGRLCGLLARASGHAGMAGGQAIDLASVGKSLDEASLREMHRLKTGALIRASVLLGAATARHVHPVQWQSLERFGDAIGLAFQVVDDILDCTADSTQLGKTAGKDEAQDKPTYVRLMGLDGARGYADELLARAREALQDGGWGLSGPLSALADLVVVRQH